MSEAAEMDASLTTAIDRHGFVVGLAGWSGSGKTTLAEKLIAHLTATGLDIATIKHAHHMFDADKPGKDSYRHRAAGARQVIVSSRAGRLCLPKTVTGAKVRLLICCLRLARRIL